MSLHYTLHAPHLNETILLLHGMGSAGLDWELQFPALAPHYRVLAPDARGHGASPKPRGPYTIAYMAEEVANLLDTLQIESTHVVGLSMGGCMALQLAITRPDRVRSLVLVNTFAKIRPAGWRGLRRFFQRVWLLQFGSVEKMGEPVICNLFPKPEQADLRRIGLERFRTNNQSKAIYRAVLGAVVRFDARPSLAQLHCPTLVVSGDRDFTVPMHCKEELRRNIRGAELIVISDSGHATPIDQPERFNAVLLEFLQRQIALCRTAGT